MGYLIGGLMIAFGVVLIVLGLKGDAGASLLDAFGIGGTGTAADNLPEGGSFVTIPGLGKTGTPTKVGTPAANAAGNLPTNSAAGRGN